MNEIHTATKPYTVLGRRVVDIMPLHRIYRRLMPTNIIKAFDADEINQMIIREIIMIISPELDTGEDIPVLFGELPERYGLPNVILCRFLDAFKIELFGIIRSDSLWVGDHGPMAKVHINGTLRYVLIYSIYIEDQ